MIDLHLGFKTREHADIEIAIFRTDQLKFYSYLKGWEFKKIHKSSTDIPGKIKPWNGEYLELPTHEIHLNCQTSELSEFEVLLNERDKSNWIYRRNPQIKRELSRASLDTEGSIPYLAPEIVLLYKSKNPRPNDEADFSIVLNRLEDERKTWLRSALEVCHPGHLWLNSLASR